MPNFFMTSPLERRNANADLSGKEHGEMPKHGEQNVGHIGCRQDVDRNGLPVSCLLSPDSDHSADIWGGPFRAISEVGPALFNRFGGAHRAPGSIDTPGLLTHP